MDKLFSSLAVSVDGFITGRGPGPGHGLGDGGMLFGWYFDGDTPSQVFDSFRLSEPSRNVFDDLAGRIGLSLVEAVPAPGVIHLRYRIEKFRRAGVG